MSFVDKALCSYSIPRRPSEDGLFRVDQNSPEGRPLLKLVERSFLDTDYQCAWQLQTVYFIRNLQLETDYRRKKQSLKELLGARELTEEYLFSCYNTEDVVLRVAQEGMFCRETSFNSLGNSTKGINLCKHADVQLEAAKFIDYNTCWLMIHKAVIPRKKVVHMFEQSPPWVDPTPNYDCHISNLEANLNQPLRVRALTSQMYLYEYNEDAVPAQRPTNCMPYAALRYAVNDPSNALPPTIVPPTIVPPAVINPGYGSLEQVCNNVNPAPSSRSQALRNDSGPSIPRAHQTEVAHGMRTNRNFPPNVTVQRQEPPYRSNIPDIGGLSRANVNPLANHQMLSGGPGGYNSQPYWSEMYNANDPRDSLLSQYLQAVDPTSVACDPSRNIYASSHSSQMPPRSGLSYVGGAASQLQPMPCSRGLPNRGNYVSSTTLGRDPNQMSLPVHASVIQEHQAFNIKKQQNTHDVQRYSSVPKEAPKTSISMGMRLPTVVAPSYQDGSDSERSPAAVSESAQSIPASASQAILRQAGDRQETMLNPPSDINRSMLETALRAPPTQPTPIPPQRIKRETIEHGQEQGREQGNDQSDNQTATGTSPTTTVNSTPPDSLSSLRNTIAKLQQRVPYGSGANSATCPIAAVDKEQPADPESVSKTRDTDTPTSSQQTDTDKDTSEDTENENRHVTAKSRTSPGKAGKSRTPLKVNIGQLIRKANLYGKTRSTATVEEDPIETLPDLDTPDTPDQPEPEAVEPQKENDPPPKKPTVKRKPVKRLTKRAKGSKRSKNAKLKVTKKRAKNLLVGQAMDEKELPLYKALFSRKVVLNNHLFRLAEDGSIEVLLEQVFEDTPVNGTIPSRQQPVVKTTQPEQQKTERRKMGLIDDMSSSDDDVDLPLPPYSRITESQPTGESVKESPASPEQVISQNQIEATPLSPISGSLTDNETAQAETEEVVPNDNANVENEHAVPKDRAEDETEAGVPEENEQAVPKDQEIEGRCESPNQNDAKVDENEDEELVALNSYWREQGSLIANEVAEILSNKAAETNSSKLVDAKERKEIQDIKRKEKPETVQDINSDSEDAQSDNELDDTSIHPSQETPKKSENKIKVTLLDRKETCTKAKPRVGVENDFAKNDPNLLKARVVLKRVDDVPGGMVRSGLWDAIATVRRQEEEESTSSKPGALPDPIHSTISGSTLSTTNNGASCKDDLLDLAVSKSTSTRRRVSVDEKDVGPFRRHSGDDKRKWLETNKGFSPYESMSVKITNVHESSKAMEPSSDSKDIRSVVVGDDNSTREIEVLSSRASRKKRSNRLDSDTESSSSSRYEEGARRNIDSLDPRIASGRVRSKADDHDTVEHHVSPSHDKSRWRSGDEYDRYREDPGSHEGRYQHRNYRHHARDRSSSLEECDRKRSLDRDYHSSSRGATSPTRSEREESESRDGSRHSREKSRGPSERRSTVSSRGGTRYRHHRDGSRDSYERDRERGEKVLAREHSRENRDNSAGVDSRYSREKGASRERDWESRRHRDEVSYRREHSRNSPKRFSDRSNRGDSHRDSARRSREREFRDSRYRDSNAYDRYSNRDRSDGHQRRRDAHIIDNLRLQRESIIAKLKDLREQTNSPSEMSSNVAKAEREKEDDRHQSRIDSHSRRQDREADSPIFDSSKLERQGQKLSLLRLLETIKDGDKRTDMLRNLERVRGEIGDHGDEEPRSSRTGNQRSENSMRDDPPRRPALLPTPTRAEPDKSGSRDGRANEEHPLLSSVCYATGIQHEKDWEAPLQSQSSTNKPLRKRSRHKSFSETCEPSREHNKPIDLMSLNVTRPAVNTHFQGHTSDIRPNYQPHPVPQTASESQIGLPFASLEPTPTAELINASEKPFQPIVEPQIRPTYNNPQLNPISNEGTDGLFDGYSYGSRKPADVENWMRQLRKLSSESSSDASTSFTEVSQNVLGTVQSPAQIGLRSAEQKDAKSDHRTKTLSHTTKSPARAQDKSDKYDPFSAHLDDQETGTKLGQPQAKISDPLSFLSSVNISDMQLEIVKKALSGVPTGRDVEKKPKEKRRDKETLATADSTASVVCPDATQVKHIAKNSTLEISPVVPISNKISAIGSGKRSMADSSSRVPVVEDQGHAIGVVPLNSNRSVDGGSVRKPVVTEIPKALRVVVSTSNPLKEDNSLSQIKSPEISRPSVVSPTSDGPLRQGEIKRAVTGTGKRRFVPGTIEKPCEKKAPAVAEVEKKTSSDKTGYQLIEIDVEIEQTYPISPFGMDPRSGKRRINRHKTVPTRRTSTAETSQVPTQSPRDPHELAAQIGFDNSATSVKVVNQTETTKLSSSSKVSKPWVDRSKRYNERVVILPLIERYSQMPPEDSKPVVNLMTLSIDKTYAKILEEKIYDNPTEGVGREEREKILQTGLAKSAVLKEMHIEQELDILAESIEYDDKEFRKLQVQVLEESASAEQLSRFGWLQARIRRHRLFQTMWHFKMGQIKRYQKASLDLVPADFLLEEECESSISVEGVLLFLRPVLTADVCRRLYTYKIEIEDVRHDMDTLTNRDSITTHLLETKLGWLHFQRKNLLSEICYNSPAQHLELTQKYSRDISWFRILQDDLEDGVQPENSSQDHLQFVKDRIFTLEQQSKVLRQVQKVGNAWEVKIDEHKGPGMGQKEMMSPPYTSRPVPPQIQNIQTKASGKASTGKDTAVSRHRRASLGEQVPAEAVYNSKPSSAAKLHHASDRRKSADIKRADGSNTKQSGSAETRTETKIKDSRSKLSTGARKHQEKSITTDTDAEDKSRTNAGNSGLNKAGEHSAKTGLKRSSSSHEIPNKQIMAKKARTDRKLAEVIDAMNKDPTRGLKVAKVIDPLHIGPKPTAITHQKSGGSPNKGLNVKSKSVEKHKDPFKDIKMKKAAEAKKSHKEVALQKAVDEKKRDPHKDLKVNKGTDLKHHSKSVSANTASAGSAVSKATDSKSTVHKSNKDIKHRSKVSSERRTSTGSSSSNTSASLTKTDLRKPSHHKPSDTRQHKDNEQKKSSSASNKVHSSSAEDKPSADKKSDSKSSNRRTSVDRGNSSDSSKGRSPSQGIKAAESKKTGSTLQSKKVTHKRSGSILDKSDKPADGKSSSGSKSSGSAVATSKTIDGKKTDLKSVSKTHTVEMKSPGSSGTGGHQKQSKVVKPNDSKKTTSITEKKSSEQHKTDKTKATKTAISSSGSRTIEKKGEKSGKTDHHSKKRKPDLSGSDRTKSSANISSQSSDSLKPVKVSAPSVASVDEVVELSSDSDREVILKTVDNKMSAGIPSQKKRNVGGTTSVGTGKIKRVKSGADTDSHSSSKQSNENPPKSSKSDIVSKQVRMGSAKNQSAKSSVKKQGPEKTCPSNLGGGDAPASKKENEVTSDIAPSTSKPDTGKHQESDSTSVTKEPYRPDGSVKKRVPKEALKKFIPKGRGKRLASSSPSRGWPKKRYREPKRRWSGRSFDRNSMAPSLPMQVPQNTAERFRHIINQVVETIVQPAPQQEQFFQGGFSGGQQGPYNQFNRTDMPFDNLPYNDGNPPYDNRNPYRDYDNGFNCNDNSYDNCNQWRRF